MQYLLSPEEYESLKRTKLSEAEFKEWEKRKDEALRDLASELKHYWPHAQYNQRAVLEAITKAMRICDIAAKEIWVQKP